MYMMYIEWLSCRAAGLWNYLTLASPGWDTRLFDFGCGEFEFGFAGVAGVVGGKDDGGFAQSHDHIGLPAQCPKDRCGDRLFGSEVVFCDLAQGYGEVHGELVPAEFCLGGINVCSKVLIL